MTTAKIQLAIIDDEQLITNLLADFFSKKENIEVVFTAFDVKSFLNYLEQESNLLPDILLLDLRIKEGNGMELASILQQSHPEIKIIIISSYYKKNYIGQILKLGASAFLPKGILPENLYQIINWVMQKGHYFLPEQIEVMRRQLRENTPKLELKSNIQITSREQEVLQLICEQYTTQEIADQLFLSKRTVEGHRNRIISKTGVKNTAGLVVFAIQHKLVDIIEL